MDEYDYLTDSQWDLYDRMSAISEDCFCAGWIGDNEYNIWNAMVNGDSSPAHRRMSPRLLRRCQKLSAEIGGWIFWARNTPGADQPDGAAGPRFAPMAQWLVMIEERRKLDLKTNLA